VTEPVASPSQARAVLRFMAWRVPPAALLGLAVFGLTAEIASYAPLQVWGRRVVVGDWGYSLLAGIGMGTLVARGLIDRVKALRWGATAWAGGIVVVLIAVECFALHLGYRFSTGRFLLFSAVPGAVGALGMVVRYTWPAWRY
jgi:hypothetical protein